MSIKAVIFDLDGTLIDSMGLWREVDMEFLGKRGIAVPADLFDHLPQGNSFIQTATYFKDRFCLSDSVESIMQEWTDMVSTHYSESVALKEGVAELIDYLIGHRVIIGLGTSNSFELAQKVLHLHGIWDKLSVVVTGDMHLMGKPYPDIYLRAAHGLGLEPANCLVIEDTLTGVMAGKAAGMTVFAIYDQDSDGQRQEIIHLADRHFEDYTKLGQELKKLIEN